MRSISQSPDGRNRGRGSRSKAVRPHLRRQRGAVHLTGLTIILFLVVVAVFNRHAIRDQIRETVYQSTAKLQTVKQRLISRTQSTISNLLHGDFSFGSGDVTVQPGLFEDIALPPLQLPPLAPPTPQPCPSSTTTANNCSQPTAPASPAAPLSR